MAAEAKFDDLAKENHHEVFETFADSLGQVTFDGQTMRVELCTVRIDEPRSTTQATRKKHVVARLVLSQQGAIELINAGAHMASVLKQAGILKDAPPPARPATAKS